MSNTNNEAYLIKLGVNPPDKPLPYQLKMEDVHPQYNAEGVMQGGIPMEEADNFIANGLKELSYFLNDPNNLGREGRRAVMQEESFVRQWLPHFYNEDLPDNYQHIAHDKHQMHAFDSVNAAWIRLVSGAPQAPVDIIRDGRVIFTVPPMMDQLSAIGGGERNKSIGEAYRDADLMKQRLPSRAVQQAQDRTVIEAIGDFKDPNRTTITNKINYKYLFVMDEIFTYYGYPTILTPEIMSIKPEVMGYSSEHQPSRTVFEQPNSGSVEQISDDDLFD